MSVENHLNIHAVGLTMDIIQAIDTRLRRDGDDCKKIIMGNKNIGEKVMDFVVDISTKIDEIVEETLKKLDKEIENKVEKSWEEIAQEHNPYIYLARKVIK